MPQASAQPAPARRALLVPREHGAWGMLLVPLVTGACAGLPAARSGQPLLLFSVAALALFWLRTPVENALGASPMRPQSVSEANLLLAAIAGLGSLATLSLAALLWRGAHHGLLRIGGIAALAFLIQALIKTLGRWARMPAQVIGALGLTSTAAGAYYVVTGRLDERALGLWLANWIFAGNQIHFVQLRIHAARAATWAEKLRRGRLFLAGQLGMIAALLAAWYLRLLPPLALIAFLPVLARGLRWFRPGAQPLAVRRLGWSELAQAVTFGGLLVFAFLR